MTNFVSWLRKNRITLIALAILAVLFVMAARGMETKDWVITTLRGLSVGSLTFLVAAGFSLILGLLDVLNFAHGEVYMLGAYIGWTAYVRPDTVIDVITPVAFLAAAFLLVPLWRNIAARLNLPKIAKRIWPWVALVLGAAVLILTLPKYPLSKWDLEVFTDSPNSWSTVTDPNYAGAFNPPAPAVFEGASPVLVLGGILLGGLLLTMALAGFNGREKKILVSQKLSLRPLIVAGSLMVLGIVIFLVNTPLTNLMFSMGTTPRFLIAIVVATLTGAGVGALIETTFIRPLYERPVYQLMITLGLAFIIIELTRAVWGRPEFSMPKPELFAGTGGNCPAVGLGTWFSEHCSTIMVLGGRVRSYNEVFIILVGVIVLIGVWLLLQRSRIGMIIRAGVQDREMVEALGINVRRVFTFVFSLGVGLAALGGALAGPAMGLSTGMGTSVLLLALIALAIGGLTSFPGAAAGSVLVALLQQFIIKYGQIGINLPFLDEPFKPSPPIVPASTVMLMVIILLVLPQGLFGRKE